MINDVCVICGDETPYNINTHIDFRHGYVEGMGQLCRACYHGNSKDKSSLTISKNLVYLTPNDTELGEKVRQIYWESEK